MMWIIVLAGVVIALGVILVLVVPRLSRPVPQVLERETGSEPSVDLAARRSRQSALEPTENALLERRVALDSRRGTLGGDTGLLEALEAIEQRKRNGEISEDHYELEKIRLLGG